MVFPSSIVRRVALALSIAIPATAVAAGEELVPVFVVKSGDVIDGKALAIVGGLEGTGRVSLNDAGTVAFRAWWDEDGSGIPEKRGLFTQHRLVHAPGDLLSGHRVVVVGIPSLNDLGVIAFQGSWDDDLDGFIDGQGIFTEAGSLLEIDFASPEPVVDGYSILDFNPFDHPVLTDTGEVVLHATVNLAGAPPCGASCRSALVSQHRVLVAEGDLIDGTEVRSIVQPFHVPTHDVNDAGDLVFSANIRVNGESEIATFATGELLYRSGEPLAGKQLANLRSPVINDSGQIAVSAGFLDPLTLLITDLAVLTRDGVLVGDGDVIEGRTLEQTGGAVNALGNDGEVIFFARYEKDGERRLGWFTQHRFLVDVPVTIEGLEVYLLGIPEVNGRGDMVFLGAWDTDGDPVRLEGSGIVALVRNQPPVAVCADAEVPATTGTCAAGAVVDGGSFDPDGDPIELAQLPAGPYPVGRNAVELVVTDLHGASDRCPATVTVVDAEPPAIDDVTVSPAVLWPPNHQMVPVTVTAASTDACGVSACRLAAVTSNEPVDGAGDGRSAPDWRRTGDLSAELRAERSGDGAGRVYTLTVECSDPAGNRAITSLEVGVPLGRNAR